MKTILIQDAAGNEYILPETKLKEFKLLDEAIVATYNDQLLTMNDEHFALCEEWFDKFDRYLTKTS